MVRSPRLGAVAAAELGDVREFCAHAEVKRLRLEQRVVTENRGQEIVEIVRDATSEGPHHFQSLRKLQLGL